ncbi:CocE/NonD family hydrolase [Pseudohongiella nitratireducens]|nr:CocE/NonD family hydrolase [Pseudohongiella nitratireducens]MDF1624362.1 CocE/NonD family hydrolase [Pseudohongiella nitratireducens]
MTDNRKKKVMLKMQVASITLVAAFILSACQPGSDTSVTGSVAVNSGSSATAQSTMQSFPGHYQGYSEAEYDGYELSSRYIPMRDGTQIAIDVFRPTDNGEVVTEPLPVLWMHTPYHRRNYGGGLTAENYPGKALRLLPHGYVVAVADFRGLFASFGTNEGDNRGEWQEHARWDSYDITEWLAAQPWSTGNIGMWGCSATGGSQMQALTVAPPSLKAVFPMSCEWDIYPFASFGGMAPPQGVPTRLMRGGDREARDRMSVPVDGDTERVLLDAAIDEHTDNIETAGYTPFRDSVAENFGNQWWLQSSPHRYKDTIEASGIAIYSAANLDEEGPGYGPAFTFNNLTNPRKFVIGPATHCDWTTVMSETGFDILIEELRFFDHWLKGIDNGVMDEAPVTYYTYNLDRSDIGLPGWQTAESWPLPDQQLTAFNLIPDGLTTESAGEGSEISTQVDYEINNDNFWEKGIQFTTDLLSHDMQITGHPVLHLWLSSTAKDADVVARIDDIAPDGTATYYTVEGRLRASLRATEPAPYDNLGLPYHPFTEDSQEMLQPGEPVELAFDFYMMSNVFKAGHRIRLTLNFADERTTPRVSPTPENTLHFGAETPSRLILPVIPAAPM